MRFSDMAWYLVQCKPKESFRAVMHLENQGYTCFHPTHHVKRKRSGKVTSLLEPLFPYYLFVQLKAGDNWSAIRSTRGVSHLVSFNGVPASLDNALIKLLKRRCAALTEGEKESNLFQPGERVLVSEGCFKQLEGIVKAVRGDERVTLLLDLFNRSQEIEVSSMVLEAVA